MSRNAAPLRPEWGACWPGIAAQVVGGVLRYPRVSRRSMGTHHRRLTTASSNERDWPRCWPLLTLNSPVCVNSEEVSVAADSVPHMSESTAQELKRAETAVEARQQAADEEKRACLRVVAEGLPAAIDGIAKRTAQAQPDVTKALGVDGITKLRADLAAKASELAVELEDAIERIEWPSPSSEWSTTSKRDVQSALFHYFYGGRANRVAAIFKQRGYAIEDDNHQRSQGLVHPHSFYREDDFVAVADAQNSLAAARRDYDEAKKADDEDTVSGIWGDS